MELARKWEIKKVLEKPLSSIIVDFHDGITLQNKRKLYLGFLLYDPQSHRCYSSASGNTSLTHDGFEMSS